VTRRISRFALAAAAAAALTTGCSTFTNTDRVATVNGTEISRDEYDEVAEDYFAHPEMFDAPPIEDGHVSAEVARSLVGAMVLDSVLRQTLGDAEVDAASDEFLGSLPQDDPMRGLSPEIQSLFGAASARAALLAEVPSPDPAELEQRYDQSPGQLGLFCVRHILVASRAEADDVRARLADGADFAALAAELSTDPTAAQNGGAIEGSTGPCMTFGEALGTLVPQFTMGALQGSPDAPPAPIETEFGWHVLMHRPWSEVGDAVTAAHTAGASGELQFVHALLEADVEVDPTYGIWDSGTISVVPLG
jgi:hypothetical protein